MYVYMCMSTYVCVCVCVCVCECLHPARIIERDRKRKYIVTPILKQGPNVSSSKVFHGDKPNKGRIERENTLSPIH